MMLASMCAAFAFAGPVRNLDKVSRTYHAHLEITEGAATSVSDYDIELSPARPKKNPKDGAKGNFELRLTHLHWHAGDLDKREAVFGAGILDFRADGIPPGIIAPGWALAPLLSFYVPGSDATILSDVPVDGADAGSGWILKGTVRISMAETSGQKVTLKGKLSRNSAGEIQVTSNATLDSVTGWPISAMGNLDTEKETVSYSLALVSG